MVASSDEAVEETDSVSVSLLLSFFLSFSFFDFLVCETITSPLRRRERLAYCFSFVEDGIPKLRILDIGSALEGKAEEDSSVKACHNSTAGSPV